MEGKIPSTLTTIMHKRGIPAVNALPNYQFIEMLKETGISSCSILSRLNQQQLQLISSASHYSQRNSKPCSKSLTACSQPSSTHRNAHSFISAHRSSQTPQTLTRLERNLIISNILEPNKSKCALVKLCMDNRPQIIPSKLIAQQIRSRYQTNKDSYNSKVINDIIYNEDSHVVSIFKDYLIFDDINEFLRRYYTAQEASVRLIKVFNFYDQYSKVFPNYIAVPESKYMFKNIEKKQKLLDEMQKNEEKHKQAQSKDKSIFSNDFLEELNKTDSFEEPSQYMPKDSFLNSYMKNSHLMDITSNGLTGKLLSDSISFTDQSKKPKIKNGKVKLESIKPSLFTNKLPPTQAHVELTTAIFSDAKQTNEKANTISMRNSTTRKLNSVNDQLITDSVYSSLRAAKVYNYNPPKGNPVDYICKSNPITCREPKKAVQLSPFKAIKPIHNYQDRLCPSQYKVEVSDSHLSGSRISAPSIDQHSTRSGSTLKPIYRDADNAIKKRYNSNINIKELRRAESKPPRIREEWVGNYPSPKKPGFYSTRNKPEAQTERRKLNNIDEIAKLYCIGPLIRGKIEHPMLRKQSIDKKALTEIVKTLQRNKVIKVKSSSKTPIPARVMRESIILCRREKQLKHAAGIC